MENNTFDNIASHSVAMIVDTWNGAVVRALGGGFGRPNCAAIDSVHRWLHVGDAWGVIATYDINDALSVQNTSLSKSNSTSVFDLSAGMIHIPHGETQININYFGLGLGEGGEYEAQNCQPAPHLIRSRNVQLTAEPPLSLSPCYR